MARERAVVGFLLSVWIVAAQGTAPIESRHPDAVQVFHCGFEERADRDLNAWPDGWTRKRGPDYPAYLPIKIAETEAPEGQFALGITLNGGAAAAYSPAIEVGSLFSYVLEGYVRTSSLKNDRAFLSLTFYDAQGKILESFTSPRFQDAGKWTKVRLGPLTTSSEQVKTAVIGVHLAASAGWPDLRGSAEFDDIWLGRLPRMSLTSNQRGNVYSDPKQVEITCKVSGIFERSPVMKCELLDADGRAVAEPAIRRLESRPVSSFAQTDVLLSAEDAKQDEGFFGSMQWKPAVPGPGFYTARVTLEGSSENILERHLTLAVLDARRKTAQGEFGWSLPKGDQPLPYSVLSQILPEMGLSWAKFPVWFSENDVTRLDELVAFAERLGMQGIESVGILADPPADVRPDFGDSTFTAAAIFSTEPELWYKSLEPITTRMSLQVHWWQLGHDNDISFVGDPNLTARIAGVKKQLEQFGQRANMGFAWQIMHEPPQDKQPPWSFLCLVAKPSLTEGELAHYLPTINPKQAKRWAMIEPLSRARYSVKDRASDLVYRMVSAKRQGAEGIFVPDPFDAEHGLMNEDGTPGELLMPWRTTAQNLSGAQYLGSIKLPGGSENHVFARDGEIVMVAWNPREVEEKIFLGDNVRQIDVWGRSNKPPLDDREHVFRVGPLPVFIVGIQEPILRWNMEFAFEKTQLPSIFGRPLENKVHLKNFFPQGTSGQIRLHTPEVWQTYSRVIPIKLASGETQNEPFTIRLPFDATNGRYPIRVDFEITADRDYQFSVYRELNVGLDDVLIELSSHINAQGDLEVEQFFTNKTDQLVSFKCSLFAPGRRRVVSQVTRLGTQRENKRYLFPNGKELIGKTLWLRAEEIGGERTFNYQLIAKE